MTPFKDLQDIYFILQKKLIAKSIEELSFEEILTPQLKNQEGVLDCLNGVKYVFKGKIGPWGNIQVNKNTLQKKIDNKTIMNFSFSDFFKEIQDKCKMTDDTLARYIEEGNQTLYAEILSEEILGQTDITRFSRKKFWEIDQALLSHPKIIMNKGRIGWGSEDLKRYAPESKNRFQLIWLAIKKTIVLSGYSFEDITEDLYKKLLSPKELEFVFNSIEGNIEEYYLLPVHPWQWDRYLKIQFFNEIISGNIIELGAIGKNYSPQSSLRTLSPDDDSGIDIKLSLSILNTSCVRGIPGKYIEVGHEVSKEFEKIITSDPFLSTKLRVLKEFCAFRVSSTHFENIKHSSYRYKEFFATVFRESVCAKLKSGEGAIPTAALLFEKGKESFIGEMIKWSGLDTEEWLRRYFASVVVPLYHLQVEHGLGLVAHGQNTILVHENGIPTGLIVKDFHGDLRLSSDSKHSHLETFKILDRLPPHYLIHDLFTGHFITVLRYLSRTVEEQLNYKESLFYHQLGKIIKNYENKKPSEWFEKNGLLRDSMEKVLVNSVRFKVGYDETPQRLKPLLGKNIKNPLVKVIEVLNVQ